MKFDRRHLCKTMGAGIILAGSRLAYAQETIFRPEDFGARGDGSTNDTAAFAAMAASVNAAGGGTIELGRRTYIVGGQTRVARAEWGYAPAPILDLRDCRLPITIRGNGARLRCAPGLRFGTFDPVSGAPTRHAMPFYRREQRACPYIAMISITRASAAVIVEDVELDGNVGRLVIGGEWGDTGWQIPGSGILLIDNRGSEILRNISSHHHPLDGVMIDGLSAASPQITRLLQNVQMTDNGRQGLSVIGGHGYAFLNCEFGRSARGPVQSSPKAGVDIEAEGGKTIRSLRFADCAFFDNAGCGVVCDSGDSADLHFENSRFVGTTSWAAWPRKPGVTFDGCSFIGAICNVFGDTDPRRATRFANCDFLDDPALANGRIYLAGGTSGPIADLAMTENVLFDRCRFRLTHAASLPWSTGAIYMNCEMGQRSGTPSYPRGIFRGRNMISGAATLEGSVNEGELVLNGRRLAPGRL